MHWVKSMPPCPLRYIGFTNWVGSVEWTAPKAPALPAINPLLAIAFDLEELSCKQIRSEFGLKQKTSKTKLIGAALAC